MGYTKKRTATKRNVVGQHNGFSIIKVRELEYHKNYWGDGYDTSWIDNENVHFDFVKVGDENKPTQIYSCWAENIPTCKECIDKFLGDDTLYFTYGEKEKYVYAPNRKCHWAYGYDSLMRVMREHKKADNRLKILIEDRLEDANFHSECGYLRESDYEGFIALVTKQYTFKEKFEVFTKTESKAIKDPKRFEDGLKKVIADYIASQGVEKTSVEVNFIENW